MLFHDTYTSIFIMVFYVSLYDNNGGYVSLKFICHTFCKPTSLRFWYAYRSMCLNSNVSSPPDLIRGGRNGTFWSQKWNVFMMLALILKSGILF